MSLVNLEMQCIMHPYVWAPFGKIFVVKKYIVKLGTQAKRKKHKDFVDLLEGILIQTFSVFAFFLEVKQFLIFYYLQLAKCQKGNILSFFPISIVIFSKEFLSCFRIDK